MKRNHLLILLLLSVFAGCKKESDEDFYVSFMVNGVEKRYTGYVAGSIELTAGYATLIVVGSVSSTATDDYLGIYISNDPGRTAINPGEYTDANPNFTVLTTHARNGVEYEAGHSVAEEAMFYGVTIPNRFKVTITQRESDRVRGTFSGDYYEDGNVRFGEKISITNGQFYSKLQ